jgi:hypothetical protein
LQYVAFGGHFWNFIGNNLQLSDCLAGDAVLIAPVSKQIPWYQGILQGILRFWSLRSQFRCMKPLCCSDFREIPYADYQGK